MKANALTAQNCSLFEIDAELEAVFDQMQEEREIIGNISEESRERLGLLTLFALNQNALFPHCNDLPRC